MRYIYFYVVLFSLLLSSCGTSKPDVYSNGIVRVKDGTLRVKKSAKHVKSLGILNYTDTIFPNNKIAQFKNLKSLSIETGFYLRLSEEEARSKELIKKHFDSLRLVTLKYRLKIEDDLLDSIKNVENLALFDFYMHSFPIKLSKLKNLEELRLDVLDISHFPKDINDFQNLKFLEINGYGNSEFPAEIIFPTKLKELKLWMNVFPEIANSIHNSNIEKLVITTWHLSMSLNEKIKLIEALGKVDNLRSCKILLETCEEKAAIKAAIKDKLILKKVKLIVGGEPICL